MFQMHGMENLDLMSDPSSSMTTLTPMTETPITSSHHQLHGSYHSMNHMMGHHHHGGPLSGHTPGAKINENSIAGRGRSMPLQA